MRLIKAPTQWNKEKNEKVIFLAGSISMGEAEKWQDSVAEALKDIVDVLILSPRRDDWDSSWVQEIENEQFREQVEWELDGQERADLILLYFDPATKSPITLMELGRFWNKCFVCCPEGFWRKGNVDVFCNRYKVPVVTDKEKFITVAQNVIKKGGL
jgi:hypothetical protein